MPRTVVYGKKKKAGRNTALAVLAIIGGVGLSLMLLCGGAIAAIGYFGVRHSGWTEATFHGYTIRMPPGDASDEKTTSVPGITLHEKIFRRNESGSQYIVMVSEPLAASFRDIQISELVRKMSVTLGEKKPVERAGISGIHGTIRDGGLSGSEAEYFIHNERLIVCVYAAYSAIKDRVGGKRRVRANESELDKPEEFFESLRFP